MVRNGRRWRDQESLTMSQWTSLGRSSWRAHARMAPSCSVQWVLSASGMLAQIRRQGGNNAAHVARSRSLRGARQTECTFSRQDLLSRRKPRARRGSRRWSSLLANSRMQSWKRRPGLHFFALKDQTTRHAQLACRWTARWLDTDGSRLRSFAITKRWQQHRTRLLPPKPCSAKPHKGPRWPALQRPRSR